MKLAIRHSADTISTKATSIAAYMHETKYATRIYASCLVQLCWHITQVVRAPFAFIQQYVI